MFSSFWLHLISIFPSAIAYFGPVELLPSVNLGILIFTLILCVLSH